MTKNNWIVTIAATLITTAGTIAVAYIKSDSDSSESQSEDKNMELISRVYEGYIGTHPVTMTLRKDDRDNLEGNYFYKNNQRKFEIRGDVDDGDFRLETYNMNNGHVEYFVGTWGHGGESLHGIWESPGLDKKLTFKLNQSRHGNVSPQGSANEIPDEFYIVSVIAVGSEKKAKSEVYKLVKQGYSASYLWIPDYQSLGSAKMYAVYIGPFEIQHECEVATENYRKIKSNAYGLWAGHKNIRIEIRGEGQVKVTENYYSK